MGVQNRMEGCWGVKSLFSQKDFTKLVTSPIIDQTLKEYLVGIYAKSFVLFCYNNPLGY